MGSSQIRSSAFYGALERELTRNGGLFNAHAHVDRYDTLDPRFLGSGADMQARTGYALWDEVDVTPDLHRGPAYTRRSLRERMTAFLAESEACGVRRVESFIDVTTDLPLAGGLGALEMALEVSGIFSGRVDFRVGAFAPFGFEKDDQQELERFQHAITLADFIATSPERDDESFYGAGPGHIGFRTHLDWTLGWAVASGKPVHYHLDQQVSPNERGTEALVVAIDRTGLRDRIVALGASEPLVWAVHCISPSTYPRRRLEELATRMAECRIGVVCCPSAALSMRKRPLFEAPIHKSIADVLLLLERGVRVRVGTDNVGDLFLPATLLDPRHEVGALANALRFYDAAILAKLACGKALDEGEVEAVRDHLRGEQAYVESFRGTKAFPL